MGFVKGTFVDLRIIGAGSLRGLHVWVDSSRAVHENMRGYTARFRWAWALSTANHQNKNLMREDGSEVVGIS